MLPLLVLSVLVAAAPAPRQLTPKQEEERAEKTLDQTRELVAQVEKLVGKAKDEKDLVKLNCAQERLGQVRGLLKVSEQAEEDLRAAHLRKEADAAERAGARVTIVGRKVQQLRQDAQQCIGQLAFYNDEKTLLEVEVPAGLPEDPTALPVAPWVAFRPPPASGF